MAIEFIEEGRDRVVKCVVLTRTLVEKVQGVVASNPRTDQSSVIRRILDHYFATGLATKVAATETPLLSPSSD